MVYVSFINIVNLGAIFPVHHYQKTNIEKDAVHWIAISLHHLILMCLLYGKKVYIILFRQRLNTIKHFRNRLFSTSKEHMERKSNEKKTNAIKMRE